MGFVLPEVTVVNLHGPREFLDKKISWVKGNALNLPFDDNEFEVSMSNSVLEHMDSWQDQVKFAGVTIRVAKKYFVQVPCKEFPIDPHFLSFFIHWFSKRTQMKLVRNFSLYGLMERPSSADIKQRIEGTNFITIKQITSLFSDSKIFGEKFLGFQKV